VTKRIFKGGRGRPHPFQRESNSSISAFLSSPQVLLPNKKERKKKVKIKKTDPTSGARGLRGRPNKCAKSTGSTIPLKETTLGTKRRRPRWQPKLRPKERGGREDERATLVSQTVSVGRCNTVSELLLCRALGTAAQARLSWFLAPSFGTEKMIDCTGKGGWTDAWGDRE
jgi:hypothetical protein